MKTIRSFEENNLDSAKEHWSELKLISPGIYGEDFIYSGDKCLFSIALEKYLSRQKQQKFEMPENLTQHEKIISILKQASSPIAKDFLFELVYKKKPISKDDYQTLAKAIYRLKKKKGLHIHFIKGCYSLTMQ